MSEHQPKDHQPLPVAGYRPQGAAAITLVNAHKALEEQILRVLDGYAGSADIDQRWLAIGRTQLEQAFMALNRAVFRPGRATLEDDVKTG